MLFLDRMVPSAKQVWKRTLLKTTATVLPGARLVIRFLEITTVFSLKS